MCFGLDVSCRMREMCLTQSSPDALENLAPPRRRARAEPVTEAQDDEECVKAADVISG